MANVTTTALQKVRPYVRSATTSNLLLLLAAYISIVALWGVRQPDMWLNFEFARYARYIQWLEGTIHVAPAVAMAVLLTLRTAATTFFLLTLRLLGHRLDHFRIVTIVLLGECVYLLPSWLQIFWNNFLQGNLNDLPPGSFEPLMLLASVRIGYLEIDLSSINSYGLMQLLWTAAYITSKSEGSGGKLFLTISSALLSGAIIIEFAWALLGPLA